MLEKYEKRKEEIEQNVLPFIKQGLGSSIISTKTFLFSLLISEYDLKTTLDLGVYMGGSLLPMAYTHKNYTNGMVYAVDPYTKENFKQYSDFLPLESLNKYIEETDFDEICETAINSVKEINCSDNVTFLRQPSNDAIEYFKENDIFFDLIHIDGNHDEKNVMTDAINYLPRLKDNGFLILDDSFFPSVKPAGEYLKENLTEIYQILQFTIFQKSDNIDKDLEALLKTI